MANFRILQPDEVDQARREAAREFQTRLAVDGFHVDPTALNRWWPNTEDKDDTDD